MTSYEICSKYNYNHSYFKALATTEPDIGVIHKEMSKNKLSVNNFQRALLPTVQH